MSSATPVTLLCCGLLGVTADDGGILERAFTEAFATQGIVPGTAAYARSMVHVHQTRGQSAVDVFRALFPDAPGRAEAATLAFDRSYRLAVDRSGLAPMPGAAEALQQIRGSGVRVCFITGLSRGLLGLVLDTLGWWRQVDLVLCPEDAPRGYPWPDPMLCAMLRLGVTDVRETAYAGGTESGILCGRRAGAQIVAGILTGGTPGTGCSGRARPICSAASRSFRTCWPPRRASRSSTRRWTRSRASPGVRGRGPGRRLAGRLPIPRWGRAVQHLDRRPGPRQGPGPRAGLGRPLVLRLGGSRPARRRPRLRRWRRPPDGAG